MMPDNFHYYPFWSPRFWHSMRLGDWLRLLWRNRFAVHPLRVPMAVLITLVCGLNSLLRVVQRIAYGRRLAAIKIEHPPLFIIGHWRSGTTFLHELLVLDERFTSPTTFQCFSANHFLVSQRLLGPLLGLLLPSRRPMDNVAAGGDKPQEDEFALLALGVPSPYLTMAFPNRPPQGQAYLDMRGLSSADLERWKSALLEFLKGLTLRANKPIVLKSPPHTGRIRVLLEMFPQARFVHIVRDPLVIVPSTLRLWKSLNQAQGLQLPTSRGAEQYVFDCYERMYSAFEEQRALIDPSRIVDVRYEELVSEPVDQMRAIYDHLGLPGFETLRPKLEAYLADHANYQTNRHEVAPELRAAIEDRWRDYIERYGYAPAATPQTV